MNLKVRTIRNKFKNPSKLRYVLFIELEPPTVTIEQPSYQNYQSSSYDAEFATLVKEKYYVDKTEVIPRILNLSGRAVAIFLHQNAIKTTHLKSIQCYCDWKSIEGLE